MSCERYKKAVIEAAASGDRSPNGAAGEHVNSCTDCREFFTREQALLAAIDTAAQRISNAETPPALLERVQTTLMHQPHARRHEFPIWTYAFAAASVILVIFVAQNWRQAKPPAPGLSVHAVTPKIKPSAAQPSDAAIHPAFSERGHGLQSAAGRLSRVESRHLEVLVQPGEEVQLIRFCEAMQARAHPASAVVPQETDEPLRPLAIAPIEIAQLDTKNLQERGDASR
jgi:hypothetical protein